MTSAFSASLHSVESFRRVVKTRFPFRFGKSVMTEMPVVSFRVSWIAADGSRFEGVSASGIPPLWFDKRDGKTAVDNERDLHRSVLLATDAYKNVGAGTAWGLKFMKSRKYPIIILPAARIPV